MLAHPQSDALDGRWLDPILVEAIAAIGRSFGPATADPRTLEAAAQAPARAAA
jgi:hypothetical protein